MKVSCLELKKKWLAKKDEHIFHKEAFPEPLWDMEQRKYTYGREVYLYKYIVYDYVFLSSENVVLN